MSGKLGETTRRSGGPSYTGGGYREAYAEAHDQHGDRHAGGDQAPLTAFADRMPEFALDDHEHEQPDRPRDTPLNRSTSWSRPGRRRPEVVNLCEDSARPHRSAVSAGSICRPMTYNVATTSWLPSSPIELGAHVVRREMQYVSEQ
jgi:hypothetical protein